MLIKLDENLGERSRQLLADAGHDVATVGDQGLAGTVDPHLISVWAAERRCLVTLDLDFSNPFVFPPEQNAGIAVLRLPRRQAPGALYAAVGTLITALAQRPIPSLEETTDLHEVIRIRPWRSGTAGNLKGEAPGRSCFSTWS